MPIAEDGVPDAVKIFSQLRRMRARLGSRNENLRGIGVADQVPTCLNRIAFSGQAETHNPHDWQASAFGVIAVFMPWAQTFAFDMNGNVWKI